LLKIESIEALLIENLNHIKKFGISRLGIFGSYSKGQPTETSDIDILISFEPHKKTFDNYIDLKFYLIEENIKKELRDEILRSVHYVEAA